MQRICVLFAVVILLSAGTAKAQSPARSGTIGDAPRVEASIGYTYVQGNRVALGCCVRMNGGSASVALNVNQWLGVAGDFGGYYTNSVSNSQTSLAIFSYMFGPRISIRKNSRFTPFTQLLIGGAHAGGSLYTSSFQSGTTPPTARNSFALAAGGGLDVKVGSHFAIRAVQIDWFFTKFPNGLNNRQNNLRLTSGLVFRWGG